MSLDNCLRRDLWEYWECIYLILGREPRLSDFMNKSGQCDIKFDEIDKIALESISFGSLKIHTPSNGSYVYDKFVPVVFLVWAKKKRFEIPKALLILLPEEVVIPIPITVVKDTQTTKQTNKKNRPLEHPEFMSYVKSQVKQAYTCGEYLKMMIDTGFIFAEKKKYFPNDNNSDNSHDYIRHVALIKNGTAKGGKQKYLIAYKCSFEKEKLGKAQFLSSRTLEDYFKKARIQT